MKDGKLLDEMTVGITGLANKVGWADFCHAVQIQNQSPEQGTTKTTPIHQLTVYTWVSLSKCAQTVRPPDVVTLKGDWFCSDVKCLNTN